jgi:subtilisin family serine protease
MKKIRNHRHRRAHQAHGMLGKLAGTLGAIALLTAAPAMADVITFDGQKPDVFVGGDAINELGYDLLVLEGPYTAAHGISSTSGAILDPADRYSCDIVACPVGDGSKYYAGLGDGGFSLSRSDGKAFSLSSLDFAFIAPLSVRDGSYGQLVLSGVRAGGGTSLLTLDLPGQDSNDNFIFKNAMLGSAFNGAGLLSVTFSACLFDDSGACVNSLDQPAYGQAQFAVDNLSISAVPEPETWAMMLAGLGGVGLAARRRRRKAAAVVLGLASLSAQAQADDGRRSYLVQLADKPVAGYTGQVAGLAATKPAPGQRLNADAADVQAYIGYLERKKTEVLNTVSAAEVTHKYNVVFNGFAAMLSEAEVRALKKNSGVAKISVDNLLELHTSYTPAFLGLSQPGGLWSQLGGQGAAGEDIIIGIVDSGVWPENPAFADHVDQNGLPTFNGGTLAYDAPPASWKGSCDTGEGFGASSCNNKLIGARHFKHPLMTLHWSEFNSARDSLGAPSGSGGHGTHTSTTAGGNAGVGAVVGGVPLATLSGIAPRARIAAYKVCWTAPSGQSGCPSSDSVAAIEQAVLDGVNVINFSIGPTAGGGEFDDPTELAFLEAANAGVFVAASAGNSGPGSGAPAPTSHISPWLTTVGNSTHNRTYSATASLGNGSKLTGASSNANTESAKLILAKDAGKAGVPAGDLSLARCYGAADEVPALLDPAKVAGKILVCDRGANALINKSANAKAAGAAGVVIVNVDGGASTVLNAAHSLSAVHLSLADGKTLKSYVASAPTMATAALGEVKMVIDPNLPAPVMSDSSSRGPNVANANILKPDLAAPGTDILAGVTPALSKAERAAVVIDGKASKVDWAFYSGTSMASPHVAGIAALIKQRHPDWSPAAIKSALMTTAADTKPDGRSGSLGWDSSALDTGTLPWAQGAGQVVPTSAADPGLVYDADESDYIRFLCGQGLDVYSAATCQSYGSIQPYNLNLPSLTAASVIGTQTLTRTVTNVGQSNATYTAQASMQGFAVEVQPATLTLAPGAKGTFKVRLTRTTAPLETWAYGTLVWSDGNGHKVRSPISARGSALAILPQVYSEAATGSKVLTIGTGFNGSLTGVKTGLVAATQTSGSIGQYTSDAAAVAACRGNGGPGVNVKPLVVPPGTMVLRVGLYAADTSGGDNSDLDLGLLLPDGVGLFASTTTGATESIQLNNPAAGTYKVCVFGYDPQGGQAEYKLSQWVLNAGSTGGNFKVTLPGISYVNGTGTVGMSWSGLETGKRYLGAVNYMLGTARKGTTTLEVDTSEPLPKVNSVHAGVRAFVD